MRSEKVKSAALSIVFITDRKIQSLNKKFLKRAYATDVLAFDLTPEGLSYARQKGKRRKVGRIEGDIFISTDTVARNAKLYGKTPQQELTLCIVHGILHLLGYDDHRATDIKRMRKKEAELLQRLLKT